MRTNNHTGATIVVAADPQQTVRQARGRKE